MLDYKLLSAGSPVNVSFMLMSIWNLQMSAHYNVKFEFAVSRRPRKCHLLVGCQLTVRRDPANVSSTSNDGLMSAGSPANSSSMSDDSLQDPFQGNSLVSGKNIFLSVLVVPRDLCAIVQLPEWLLRLLRLLRTKRNIMSQLCLAPRHHRKDGKD